MRLARLAARREHPEGPARRVVEPVGVAAMRRVLPVGSRPSASQGGWVRAVEAHPDVGPLRADAQRNLRALVWELARWADWGDLTSRPTWERLCAAARCARSTVAKWLAWLRERALLAVVEHGSTPHLRPGVLGGADEGNRASVYLLCELARGDEPGRGDEDGGPEVSAAIFSGDRTRTPSWEPSSEGRQDARARMRPEPPLRGGAAKQDSEPSPPATIGDQSRRHDGKSAARRDDGGRLPQPWPLWRPARTRAERLALCERLRAESPPLRAAGSARRLRHLLRPWLLAGWSARGLLHAVDHAPDGALWPYAWRSVRELRNPAGWLVHRLRAWRDPSGISLPDPRAVTAPAPTTRRALGPNGDVTALARPEHVRAVAARLRAQLHQHRYETR